MGFGSFDVQILDDHCSKDLNLQSATSHEISSIVPFDSSDDEDNGHNSSQADSLNNMSSLLQQLPIKRGLSKHYEGKSKSFACLSNVRCLEDLAKPEHPYNKKLKFCKSHSGLYGKNQRTNQQMSRNIVPQSASSRIISKKTSRGSCSSFTNIAAKRKNSNNARPPTHPASYRSSNTQTPSFQAKDSLRCVVPFFTA
ncbi:Oxidative stress [Heracleum sosnowskyi]|uniref:Oxidative stress n=1 Tax=Heracleum sosnowskyi TaxID=360622 RepID=A0AAD8H7K7_9APIA|nr:Oxidative stress [Heracleum sosnowskyi]